MLAKTTTNMLKLLSGYVFIFNAAQTTADLKEAAKACANAWVRHQLPSGSGFDSGTELDWNRSTEDKLVFTTAFHHMNDSGMYDGWTRHNVTVTPSFHHGCNITVSGQNRNDIKDYIAEIFHFALTEEKSQDEVTKVLAEVG